MKPASATLLLSLLLALFLSSAACAAEDKTACREQTTQGHKAELCMRNPGMFRHFQFTLTVDGEHMFTLVDDYVETVSLTHRIPQGPALEMPLSRQGMKEVTLSGGCKPVLNAAGDAEIARLCNFRWGKVDVIKDVRFDED
jgi:hypothetical protein